MAVSGYYVNYFLVSDCYALVPDFELNLSSVIFASAAKAASSESVVAEKIADDEAMTLRLDGAGKTIGTVIYDVTYGLIVAQKHADAEGTVSFPQ